MLKSNPYFRFLDENTQFKLSEQAAIIEINSHEILFHEGDFADAFYIVKEGDVRITTLDKQGQVVFLARILSGEFFGEQAFSQLSQPRRQATATAQSKTILYKFPREILFSLVKTENTLQSAIQDQTIEYQKLKIFKLAQSLESNTTTLNKLTDNTLSYEPRAVVYFQDDPADKSFVLLDGEVELQRHDQDKKITQITTINTGQFFGMEALAAEKNVYQFTAVIKRPSVLAIIDGNIYRDSPIANCMLQSKTTNYFPQRIKGKVFQFRSEYSGLPAITSIIALQNGKEVVCHQIACGDIFIASTHYSEPSQILKYSKYDNYKREIVLVDKRIVGVTNHGVWEDSPLLLNMIINGDLVTDQQIAEFNRTGKILSDVQIQTDKIDYVCKCMRVSRDIIYDLIHSKHADFAAIQQQTGAGTVCGGCTPLMHDMLGTDAWQPCEISKVIELNSEMKSFQIKLTRGKTISFQPRKYIIIKAKINNVWIQRSYTLTSLPEQSYYEITVKREKQGIFSPGYLRTQIKIFSFIFLVLMENSL